MQAYMRLFSADTSGGGSDGNFYPSWFPAAAIAAGAALVSVVAYQLLKRPQDGIPGPAVFIPLVGESPEYFNDPAAFNWKRYKKYKSKVFWSHVFGRKLLMVGDIELCKGLLSDQSKVVAAVPVYTFQRLMGAGVSPRELPGHRLHRKNMAAGLAPPPVKQSVGAFVDIIQAHVDQWLAAAAGAGTVPQHGGAQLELKDIARNMMVQTGIEAIMGLKFANDQERKDMLKMVSTYQSGLFCVPVYLPGTTWYKALNIQEQYIAKVEQLYTRRFRVSARVSGGPALVDPTSDSGGAPGLDLTPNTLQEMMDQGYELTLRGVVRRAMLGLLAATETAASGAVGLMVITSVRADVQQKLREEQAALLSSHGPDLSWEVLATKVPYCDAVVREALRICPSAHGVFRKALQDIQLGGHKVPAGTLMMISLDLLTQAEDDDEFHKSQLGQKQQGLNGSAGSTGGGDDDWRLPDRLDVNKLDASFRPERWLNPDTRPSSLHLFNHGPYHCLGREVAMLELKIMLCLLARSARWGLKNRPHPVIKFVPYTHVTGGPVYLDLTPDPVAATAGKQQQQQEEEVVASKLDHKAAAAAS